jgi:hypothetical protein
LSRTDAAGIQRPHVEDVDTLDLSEDFETLQTSGMLKIGRDGSRLGSRGKKVLGGLDIYESTILAIAPDKALPGLIASAASPRAIELVDEPSSFLYPSRMLGVCGWSLVASPALRQCGVV